MSIAVRRAVAADADAAVLADAFADYPWTRWTVDGDHSSIPSIDDGAERPRSASWWCRQAVSRRRRARPRGSTVSEIIRPRRRRSLAAAVVVLTLFAAACASGGSGASGGGGASTTPTT